MQTPQQQLKASHDDGALIYAVDLLHALEEKKGDFKEDRWAIIQDIISVREQLERFNDNSRYCGQCRSGDHLITVLTKRRPQHSHLCNRFQRAVSGKERCRRRGR